MGRQESANDVTVGSTTTEYRYDGALRRVRTIVTVSGTVVTDTAAVYCQTELCEDRHVATGVTARKYFDSGEMTTTGRVYFRDHLESVVSTADQNGVQHVAFAPSGGDATAGGAVGFTGHVAAGTAGLILAPYRVLDPVTGTWLSEDPLGLTGGLNLYQYAQSNPLSWRDPLGLKIECDFRLQQRDVATLTRCKGNPNAAACTYLSRVGSRPNILCERDGNCGYKFDTTVAMLVVTEFRRPRNAPNSDNPSLTLALHESLHVHDLRSVCEGLNGMIQSEGFPSLTRCEAGKAALAQRIWDLVRLYYRLSSVHDAN